MPARNRPDATQRGYTYRWQQARKRYLRAHPLCRVCEAQGFVTPAKEVDHIVPHAGDMTRFWDEANWQALCRRCHEEKSRNEVTTKQKIGIDGWPE